MAERSPHSHLTKQQLADRIAKKLTKRELIAILEGHGKIVMLPKFRLIHEQEELDQQLVEAAEHGARERVEILIAEGADVNSPTVFEKHSALMEVAENGNREIVEILIREGADVNATNDWGNTALSSIIFSIYPRLRG